jgi:hypothetical protein
MKVSVRKSSSVKTAGKKIKKARNNEAKRAK